jgi:hypothetical protein
MNRVHTEGGQAAGQVQPDQPAHAGRAGRGLTALAFGGRRVGRKGPGVALRVDGPIMDYPAEAAVSLPSGGCYPAGWLELPLAGSQGLYVALGSSRHGP